jgi:hypothetical protein
MLWLVGAVSELALLVAASLPRGGVSWSVGVLVLSVGGVVFIGRGGGCAVIHAVGPPSAAYLRWPVVSSVGFVGSS